MYIKVYVWTDTIPLDPQLASRVNMYIGYNKGTAGNRAPWEVDEVVYSMFYMFCGIQFNSPIPL